MTRYNYTQIDTDLKALTDNSLNKLDYLQMMHDILVQHSVNLSKVVGRLKGEVIYLETAKGRNESGLDKEQVLKVFEEYEYSKKWLDIIDKVMIITGQRVKIIHEQN